MTALSFAALCFSSLLAMINPLGAAPLFAAMTAQKDAHGRRRAAARACALGLGLLVSFALGGGLIFRLFGITINAFRIAGGLLFFAMAMPMLLGADEPAPRTDTTADPALVPLGMPLIAGPGAISTVMVLTGQARSARHLCALLAAIGASLAVTGLTLLAAPALLSRRSGSLVAVVNRVMGLITAVIGVQFVLDGVRPVALDILAAAHRL